ncbi:hypothetical protein GC207_03735 [bacterium]|nr:hypothetical protein [bacterium]
MKTQQLTFLKGIAMLALLMTASVPSSRGAEPEYFSVDLSPHEFWTWTSYHPSVEWTPPPPGRHKFNGIPFDLTSVVQFTGVSQARTGDFRPTHAVYPVGKKFTKVHLLHHCEFRSGTGSPIAQMFLRYDDGTEYNFVLRYGLHFQDWNSITPTQRPLGATTQAAWVAPQLSNLGSGLYSGLWHTVVPNPHPDKMVKEIEFRTVFGGSSYTLDGLTLEQGEPAPELIETLGGGRNLIEPRLIERKVRFVDQVDDKPILRGRVNAWMKSGDSPTYWGEYHTDADGTITILYPVRDNVEFELAAVGLDNVPTWCSLPVLASDELANPKPTQFAMAPGKVIGGMVVDGAGMPVEDANVAISGIMKGSLVGYTLCKWPVVRTDSTGKWSIGAAPDDFQRLNLQITHPNYLPATYMQDDSGDAFTVSAVDLLQRTALTEVAAGQNLNGHVTDQGGKPLAGAKVAYFVGGDFRVPRRLTETGSDGDFLFQNLLPGAGVAVVTAPGFSPGFVRDRVQTGGEPWQFQLRPAKPLEFLVADSDGKPVSDAFVMLLDWRNGLWIDWMDQTGADGKVSWNSPPDGEAKYLVATTSSSEQVVTVSADGTVHKVTLTSAPHVELKVVDAETGKPIESFTVIKGQRYAPQQASWERYNPLPGRNGEFQMDLDQERQAQFGYVLQVKADGYYPGISDTFRSNTNLLVKLERGVPPKGRVVDATGKPVAGAELVLAGESTYAYMDKPPNFRNINNQPIIHSNPDGTFVMPIELASLGVFAAHPTAGFGQITMEELKQTGEITLRHWARVEGTLKVGEHITPDENISLHRANSGYYNPTDLNMKLQVYSSAKPAADGSFVFEQVPPVELEVALQYPTQSGQPIIWSHGVPLFLTPGMRTNVTIGGTGRSIIGRVKPSEDLAAEIEFDRGMHQLMSIPTIKPPTLRRPSGQMSQEQAQALYADYQKEMREFYESEEGREYRVQQHTYVIRFDQDGSFRCDNVPAGKYNLQLQFTKEGEQPYMQKPLANYFKQLTVEPGDTPIDLGEIALSDRKPVEPGRPAPEIPMIGMDGKPVHLADFRGKHVLLVIWSQELEGYEDTLNRLRSLQSRLGGSDKLVILALAVQTPLEKLKTIFQGKGYDWTQAIAEEGVGNEILSGYAMAGHPVGFMNSKPNLVHLISDNGTLMASVPELDQLIPFVERVVGLSKDSPRPWE